MLDITKRKESEEQEAASAFHDKLTGLPNRAMFQDLLDRALARARRPGPGRRRARIDIDDFKLVNDSLGREAGDELLRRSPTAWARRPARPTSSRATARTSSRVMLADLDRGGEPPRDDATGPDGGRIGLHQDRRAAPDAVLARRQEVFVDGQHRPQHVPGDAPATRPRCCTPPRAALHRSKETSRGGFTTYSKADIDPRVNRLSLASRLRRAVERQNWVLHYQPIVGLDRATCTRSRR